MIQNTIKNATVMLGSTCLSNSAWAQAAFTVPPPPRYQIDDNKIDRTSGAIVFAATELSIGPAGPGGLALVNYHNGNAGVGGPYGTNWDLVLYISNGAYSAVTTKSVSESFTLSGGTFVSKSGDGSSLTYSNSTYTFTASDGTQIVYGYNTKESGEGNVIRATKVIYPSGEVNTLTWKSVSAQSSNTNAVQQNAQTAANSTSTKSSNRTTTAQASQDRSNATTTIFTWVRLQSVSSSTGYQLHYNYANDAVSDVTDGASWVQLASVTAINLAADYCDPAANGCTGLTQAAASVSYAYPNTASVQVTDPLGRQTTYMKQSGSFAVTRPSSSSANYSYTLDSSARPTRAVVDGMTYTYVSSLSGAILTMTETDPLGHLNTTTSDTGLGVIKSYADSPQSGVTRTTTYNYTAGGVLSSIVLPEGNQVQYALDGRGNVTTTTSVAKSGSGLANIVTSAVYPSSCSNAVVCNKPTSTTDALGNTTTYTYDPMHGGILSFTKACDWWRFSANALQLLGTPSLLQEQLGQHCRIRNPDLPPDGNLDLSDQRFL